MVSNTITLNHCFNNHQVSIINSPSLGLSLSGSCIGGLVLAPALNVVVQTYGWKVAMLVLAGTFDLWDQGLYRPQLLHPCIPMQVNVIYSWQLFVGAAATSLRRARHST